MGFSNKPALVILTGVRFPSPAPIAKKPGKSSPAPGTLPLPHPRCRQKGATSHEWTRQAIKEARSLYPTPPAPPPARRRPLPPRGSVPKVLPTSAARRRDPPVSRADDRREGPRCRPRGRDGPDTAPPPAMPCAQRSFRTVAGGAMPGSSSSVALPSTPWNCGRISRSNCRRRGDCDARMTDGREGAGDASLGIPGRHTAGTTRRSGNREDSGVSAC